MSMLGPDKERHFIGYAALSLVVFTLVVFLSPRSAYARRWAFVAWLMMVAGTADEYRQYFDSTREADIFDAAANMAGIMAGSVPAWIVYAVWKIRKRSAGLRIRRTNRYNAFWKPAIWVALLLWLGLAFITENVAEKRAIRAIFGPSWPG